MALLLLSGVAGSDGGRACELRLRATGDLRGVAGARSRSNGWTIRGMCRLPGLRTIRVWLSESVTKLGIWRNHLRVEPA